MAEASQWNRPKKDAGGAPGTKHQAPGTSYANRKGRPFARGLLAALVVVIGGVLAFYFICGRQGAADPTASRPTEKKRGKIAEVTPAKPRARAEIVKEVKEELNEKVKDFIKKADTNNVMRMGPAPLDPDDPDNAIRTQTMTEVAMLVGIEPGDPMPPVPFSFMQDDMALEAAEKDGEKLVSLDGGNKRFLDELAKWKITIKETDSAERAAKKRELLDSQLELMQGIEEGLSVNDSIRAAYDFRVKAYETRRDLMSVISEMHAEDPDVATTVEMVKTVNAKLADEGIKQIRVSEIVPDYEDTGDDSEAPLETTNANN